jgi:hypothetical protein
MLTRVAEGVWLPRASYSRTTRLPCKAGPACCSSTPGTTLRNGLPRERSEPHLHFHVANNPSPLFSNGVPYVFREFQLEARVIGLETGEPSIVPADPPLDRHRQLPLNGDIIAFPSG